MDVLDWKINPSSIFELANNIFEYGLQKMENFESIMDLFKNYTLYAMDGNILIYFS